MPTLKSHPGSKSYWDMLVTEVAQRDKRRYTPPRPQPPAAQVRKLRTPVVDDGESPLRRSIKYSLGEPLANVYFTQREADCMMQVLQGKTMNETGDVLQLSPRTVEYYLTKIKRKIKCRKKREVINLVLQTDFIKNFQQDPFNKKEKI